MTAGLRAAAVQRPPNAAGAPLFLSYSRKDYYFAESLAFHLMRQRVPVWFDVKDLQPGADWERGLADALDAADTLVVVASVDSMRSPNVRNEWEHAIRQGKTIVVARFRGTPLPPELAHCPIVDFRGSFDGALRALAGLLVAKTADAAAGQAQHRVHLGIPLPPWVAAMAAVLAIPLTAYLVLADWHGMGLAHPPPLADLLQGLTGVLLLVWFLCISFIRRRMGMTRLAICLGVLVLLIATPMLWFGPLAGGQETAFGQGIAALVREHWRVGVALCAIPAVGLVVLVLVRPEDLLRWAPTGTAWPAYRMGHVAHAAFERTAFAARFHAAQGFRIVHDPADAPAADRLRQLLTESGAIEAGAGAQATTRVMLLTNRTGTGWLDAQIAGLPPSLLTVVGAPIGLPPSLQVLWRRQWVDFRGWDLDRADREKSLPQVPEAVGLARYPAPVNRVHQALCALCALLAILATTMVPYTPPGDAQNVPLIAAAAGALWWGWVAHRFLQRSRPPALFTRDGYIGWGVTIVAACLCGFMIATREGTLGIARVAALALILVAAYAWLGRQRGAVTFWLPRDATPKAVPVLAPGRNWRTPFSIGAYVLLWYLLLANTPSTP